MSRLCMQNENLITINSILTSAYHHSKNPTPIPENKFRQHIDCYCLVMQSFPNVSIKGTSVPANETQPANDQQMKPKYTSQ